MKSQKKMKRIFNIILSIVLVLGIVASSFGTYAVVFAGNPQGKTPNTSEGTATDKSEKEEQNAENMPDLGGAANEVELKDEVKVFTGDAAKKIDKALVSVEESYRPYNQDGNLTLTFAGEKEDLFGDLETSEYFLLEGGKGTHLGSTYIMEVWNIYQSAGQTMLTVKQPELADVFESIDIGFNDVITEKNLIGSTTVDGVSLSFEEGSAKVSEGAHVEYFDTGAPQVVRTATNASYEVTPLAAKEYSTNPAMLKIELAVDLLKGDDEEDKPSSGNSTMETEAGLECNLTGSITVEDLSAYMVCDMPKPGQFEEVFFGLRGKQIIDAGLNVSVGAEFHPEATKFKYNGLLVDAEISGLNEKWIPLGIWQFTGTTAIYVTNTAFKELRLAPSIFIMLYMDAEGEFKLTFNTSLTYQNTFNNGLSVYKDGKLNMTVMNYPYTSSYDEGEDEDGLTWDAKMGLDIDASLTVMGSSVQFYFAGIHIGEIQLLDIGVEGDVSVGIEADSKHGITKPKGAYASGYARGFLQLLGLKAKISAEVEAFQHGISKEYEFAFQLLDFTLFELGEAPEDYKNKVPVSSKMPPSSFDSVICLVTDVSGSMSSSMSTDGSKIEALKKAGHVIVNSVEKAAASQNNIQGLAVVKFSDYGETVAVAHNDYEFLNACIDTLAAVGGTNIVEGLQSGIAQLEGVEAKQKVIILMTDGDDTYNSDSEIIEQAKLAAKENIKIYTIGFGSAANQELMTQIAEEAGGEYRYSEADGLVSIIGGFLYSYEASQGDVLLDAQATVEEGKTVEVDEFTVSDDEGVMDATLYWPGSLLELILIDPNGRKVDKKYPGATIDDKSIPATVSVKDPLPGKWKYKVKGIETSYDEEPFYAITSFKKVDNGSETNPKLSTMKMIGAYCLPSGGYMILTSVSLLILINKKKKEAVEQ